MIRTLASTLALVLALGLGGAANAQTNASDPIDTDSGFELGIAQQNNSGEIGTVTLYKSHSGARTLVVISMHGTPAGIAQPAHIHRGTCDNLNPVPTWPLHNVVNGQSRTWSRRAAKHPLRKLFRQRSPQHDESQTLRRLRPSLQVIIRTSRAGLPRVTALPARSATRR